MKTRVRGFTLSSVLGLTLLITGFPAFAGELRTGDDIIVAADEIIEDDLYVIGDRCTHAEASLAEGELFDDEVECPRHGSEFNIRTGMPGALPATRPVPTYEVKVEAGIVLVHLEPGEESE